MKVGLIDVEWYQPPLFGAWYDIVYSTKFCGNCGQLLKRETEAQDGIV